jgi:hypothetical protein
MEDETRRFLERLEKKTEMIAFAVAATMGTLAGHLTYLGLEKWAGATLAGAGAGLVTLGVFVWILRKAD